MSDIEVIAYLVNFGESFGIAPPPKGKSGMQPKDVYYIKRLGSPNGGNISYIYSVFSSARKRLVASGIKDFKEWIPYFNKLDVVYMEIDDSTVLLDKDL